MIVLMVTLSKQMKIVASMSIKMCASVMGCHIHSSAVHTLASRLDVVARLRVLSCWIVYWPCEFRLGYGNLMRPAVRSRHAMGTRWVWLALALLLCVVLSPVLAQERATGAIGVSVVAQPVEGAPESHARRNAALIQTLRDAHPLELRALSVPASGDTFKMTDATGVNATCEFKPVTLDVRRQELVGSQEQEDSKPETFAQALSPLSGTCAELNEGWWTYQWCHEKEVRQYHREPSGKVTADWSLGHFVPQKSPDAPLEGRSFHAHKFEVGRRAAFSLLCVLGRMPPVVTSRLLTGRVANDVTKQRQGGPRKCGSSVAMLKERASPPFSLSTSPSCASTQS